MVFLKHSELRWIISEIHPWVVGARVQRVRRLPTGCLVLHAHRPGQTLDLIISTNPKIARVTMSIEKNLSIPADDGLAKWLKSHLRGHRIQELTMNQHHSIVEIGWSSGRLMVELFGAQPRLIGLDVNQTIRCVEPVSTDGRLRLGGVYQDVSKKEGTAASNQDPIRFSTILEVENKARLDYETMTYREEERLKRKLMTRAQKQLNRLKRKLDADLKKLGDSEEWQRKGELVKSHVWQIERGQESIAVVDYFDSEMPTIEIELKPEYTGLENVERFFKMYRRSKSGAVHIQRRMIETDDRLSKLMSLPLETLSADTLEQALRRLGIRLPPSSQATNKKSNELRRPYFEFTSGKGERILVGRGGVDNHETSFKIGKGNDHWLHVKDAPGSHVLVPVKRGVDPHPDTILDAGVLAIHYSKLRGDAAALISHTQRKYVRPVTGGKAGLVTIQKEKVIAIDDFEQRLKRLFENRMT